MLAHKMAMASDWVTADAVDAAEFPDLAQRYQVHKAAAVELLVAKEQTGHAASRGFASRPSWR